MLSVLSQTTCERAAATEAKFDESKIIWEQLHREVEFPPRMLQRNLTSECMSPSPEHPLDASKLACIASQVLKIDFVEFQYFHVLEKCAPVLSRQFCKSQERLSSCGFSCKPCSLERFGHPTAGGKTQAQQWLSFATESSMTPILLNRATGEPAQEQETANAGGQVPSEGRPGANQPSLDPFFQQRRPSLDNSPSSSYSLQNFIAQQQQQQQQQIYMQQNAPPFSMAQRPSAGVTLRGHSLAPSVAPTGPFSPAAMSFGYSSLRPASAGSMPEFNANPGAGLPYAGLPIMRHPYTPYSGTLTGHEPAWTQGESMPQLQRTMSQDYHQQQQQVHQRCPYMSGGHHEWHRFSGRDCQGS